MQAGEGFSRVEEVDWLSWVVFIRLVDIKTTLCSDCALMKTMELSGRTRRMHAQHTLWN